MTKIPKAEAVDRVTALRTLNLSVREIARRIGLGKTRVAQICRDFAIPKRTMCPHCGVDIGGLMFENSRGGVPPKES